MADDILIQGKTYAWKVNDQGEALVTLDGGLGDDLVTNYDPVGATVAYVGKAIAGTLSSAASWQVKKLVFAADGGVTTTVADGDLNFDNVWDDRASLTYS